MDADLAGDGSDGFERRLRGRLAAMFWILTGGLLALLVFTLVWFGMDQDRRALAMSERTAASAMQARLQGMAKTMSDYAVWDDAYEHVVARFDRQWIDGNIGPFVFNSLNFERSYVFDGEGRVVYAMCDGAVLDASSAALDLPPGVVSAVRRAASGEDTKPRSGLATVDGKPALLAIGRIAPSTGRFLADPAKVRLLVFVDYLDRQVLDEMAQVYALSGLAAGKPGAGEAFLPLAGEDGQSLGAIRWRQEHPGRDTLNLVAPVAALLALLLALAGSRVMAIVNRMVDRMMEDRRTAEDAIERARLALAAANAAKGDADSARRQLAEIERAHHQLERLRGQNRERERWRA